MAKRHNMGNNGRVRQTTTRSISFDNERFEKMEAELKVTKLGRSEFIDLLLMKYFESKELTARMRVMKGITK